LPGEMRDHEKYVTKGKEIIDGKLTQKLWG
jgi:hypothetical protein